MALDAAGLSGPAVPVDLTSVIAASTITVTPSTAPATNSLFRDMLNVGGSSQPL